MSRSRNSTPHRLSRSSNVLPSPGVHYPIELDKTPLDETLLPSITELNDNLVDLDSNLQNLQKIHESLTSFNESFGSFLYGLQINAYTVEFNEIPGINEINFLKQEEIKEKINKLEEYFDDTKEDDTYLTNDEDGSFLVQPKKKKSKIPRITGGIMKPTEASERRQRSAVTNNKKPPFR